MVEHAWGEFAYAPSECRSGAVIRLPKEEAHHLFRVRRVAFGDVVMVTDGEGQVHRCRAEGDHSLTITESLREFGEPPCGILLLAAVLKGDVHRDLVDTAVQLGATGVHFFRAERSEGRMTPERLERLRRTAISAIKQCGRARLPEIATFDSLSDALAVLPPDSLRFLAHFIELPVPEPAPPNQTVVRGLFVLAVGPEGGLTDAEVRTMLEAGFRPLTLGQRRLRAETAAAAGLSLLLSFCGESGPR